MKFGFGSSPERNGIPHIERVAPAAAIPGGEMTILGRGFATPAHPRPAVRFGEAEASLALASDSRLVARVPEGATGGTVLVAVNGNESQPHPVHIAIQIADNLHPVTNPAVDHDGNIFVTFSGQRGQRVAISARSLGFLVLPRLSVPMPLTIWSFIRAVICTFRVRHPPALAACTASRRAAM